MSSSRPADVNLSLEELAKHGGLTGPHKDGWGIAYYQENDTVIIREAGPAGNSDFIEFIKGHRFVSNLVLSHIRLATQGGLALKNTQPFQRELGGRMHVFTHNGDLKGIRDHPSLKLGSFQPIGQTDSEYAFCALLAKMSKLWKQGGAPSPDRRFEAVRSFALKIRKLGPANFMYADGELLFAHGHMRSLGKGKGFGPPGLHLLKRECMGHGSPGKGARGQGRFKAKGLAVASTDGVQKVVLLASVPLTKEPWLPLEEGELLAVGKGRILRSTVETKNARRPTGSKTSPEPSNPGRRKAAP